MKSFLYTALFLLPALVKAQTENFVVKGTVRGQAAATRVYLGHAVNQTWVIDSTVVKNGHFEFKGGLVEPVRATLDFGHNGTPLRQSRDKMQNIFYLENGTVEVVTSDSATKATVRGTPINAENAGLSASLNRLRERANALRKAALAQPEATRTAPAYVQQLEARLASIEAEQDKVMTDFVKEHPNSRFSLFVLFDLLTGTPDVGRYVPLYQGLSASVRNTPRGQRIGEQIKRLQKVAVGSMAPDFTQNTPDNVPVTLSSLRGKYVLLDFWASWCGPCRQENPNVVKAYNRFKDKGFTILSVSLDKEGAHDAWVRAIKTDGLPWTQVSDLKYWNNAAALTYDVKSVPQNFLLDPQGKIVAINLRGEELQSTLGKLLNKVK